MIALAWLIVKVALLLIIMMIGGVMVAYGAIIRFVLGLEARPSTVARFAWLCWGLAGLGLAIFVYAGHGVARIAFA
jgi:hypothetical protein